MDVSRGGVPLTSNTKSGVRISDFLGMLGVSLTSYEGKKAPLDMPTRKPYWGNPNVRNCQEGGGGAMWVACCASLHLHHPTGVRKQVVGMNCLKFD